MKTLIVILLLGLSVGAVAQDRVALPFWGAAGQLYMTDSFGKTLAEQFPGIAPTLMLVLTENHNSPEFRQQKKRIEELGHDAEDLQLLVAVSKSSQEEWNGYWLDPKTAMPLLGRERFIVVFLRGDGSICGKSKVPLNLKQIQSQARRCGSLATK